MAGGNKVIWSEGMFLRPQHFQQQDRHTEQLINSRINALSNETWGVQRIAIDNALLELGKISILEINAIFPDGSVIQAPQMDPLPEIIDIPDNTRNQTLHLCVALKRAGSQESTHDGEENPQARYLTYNLTAQNSSIYENDTAKIQVGKLKTCFKFEADDRSGYASIAITRIIEKIKDHPIKLDKGFIPPLLHCDANPEIQSYTNELKGLLKQRGDALGNRLADSGRSGSAEIADYLLLQVINRIEPLIILLTSRPKTHPFDLYTQLVVLAGELATFTAKTKRFRLTPPYQHDNLQETFAGVFSSLRQSLSTVLEQSATSLDLVERKFGIYVAPLTDPSLTRTSSFILAVKADQPTEEIRTKFSTQIKIAPVENIRGLVSAQLPGINIRPLPVAPRQIPYHSGFTYFELQQHGDLWNAMQKSGGFAVHLGANFPGLIMELWAIRNS